MKMQLEKERLERIQREGECCLLFERQFNLVEYLCASFELLCAHHQHYSPLFHFNIWFNISKDCHVFQGSIYCVNTRNS
jgi:hypothetical protein